MRRVLCWLLGHARAPHRSVPNAAPYQPHGWNYCHRCGCVYKGTP